VTSGPIVALTAHARSVAAPDRSGLAATLREALADGGLVIETCHRVEGYAAAANSAALAVLTVPAGSRLLRDTAAVRQAISVAVGRDSVMLGEDQVLHQVREAVDAARTDGGLDPTLERLFGTALRAGRRARSWRQGPSRSLATVALASIERSVGSVADRPLMIVGAGRMGQLAARTGRERGALLRIASRSRSAAEQLATETHGRTEPFDPGAAVAEVVAVIVALAGPWPIADDTQAALAESSAVVVDLSVPAAVPADLAGLLGARLVTADDLARAEWSLDPPEAVHLRRLDDLIDRATAEFLDWSAGHARRAVAAALAERVEQAREAELAVLWRRLPDADPETRAAIEGMTRHLAARLLREPLEQLGQDPNGRAERSVREAFAL
jgi:glutamyl-tRNA reductase